MTVSPTLIVRQDLSEACASAVAPLRVWIGRPGMPVSPEELSKVRALAEKSYDDCSPVEFARFRDNELIPWARTLHKT